MGGGPHGDLASRIAVETAHECIARSSPDTQASERIERAVLQARTRICDAILENAELNGMGTTLVGLLLEDHRRAVIAHVGDSRAYRLRGDRLEVLTQDHTMATALVREGHLTEREAVNHRLSHVLTRALCCEGRCEVEITKASVAAGDLFLLCSDGLSNMLSAEEILALLLDGRDTEETCERLIQAALSQGGNDNITVVLVEILEAGS